MANFGSIKRKCQVKLVKAVTLTAVILLGLAILVSPVQAATVNLAKNTLVAFSDLVANSEFINSTTFLAELEDKSTKQLPQSAPRQPDMVVKGAVITAYTSTPDQTDSDPFIAASGRHVYDGMIAANFLPLGTKIKIPSLYGEKIFTVHDRMNSRYGYGRLDIWLDTTKAEARKFGVKRVDIEVYIVNERLAQK